MTFPLFWRGARDARRWHWVAALLVSIGVHLPLTPLALVWRLLGISLHSSSDWDYQDDTVVVPVSLEMEDTAPAPPAVPSPSPAAAPPAAGEQASPRAARPGPLVDAGVDAAAREDARDGGKTRDAGRKNEAARKSAAADGGSLRARELDGGTAVEAGASGVARVDAGNSGAVAARSDGGGEPLASSGAGDGGPGSLGDRLGLGGAMDKATKVKANVVLALWLNELRSHPLGHRFGELLACIPQWKEFLAGVDPMDLDAVMVSGPQLADSSKVTIMVQQHTLGRERMRAVVADLVARSNGRGALLDGAAPGDIAARFRADRADRVIMTHPRDLIFITPPEGFEQIRRIREPLSMPPSKGRAISVALVNPWRPARRVGIALPQTITELSVDITPASDGGADIRAEFDEADANAAPADAETLRAQLAGYSLFIGSYSVTTDGPRITVKTRLSQTWSAFLLGMVEAQACPLGADGGRSGAAGRVPGGPAAFP